MNDMGEVSELVFLTSLARQRNESLGCVEQQIHRLTQNQAEGKSFADDLVNKIFMLAEQQRIMRELEPRLGSGDGSVRDSYKNAKTAFELIQSTIAFREIPQMQRLVNALVSQAESFTGQEPSERVTHWFSNQITSILPRLLQLVRRDRGILTRAVQSNATEMADDLRESLAQDTDLVKEFSESQSSISESMRAVACRIDAKYGRGAQVRQLALDGASLVVLGVTSGLLRGLGAAVASGRTRIVGSRLLPVSRIERGLVGSANAYEAYGLYGAFKASCMDERVTLSAHNAGQCSESVVTPLENSNCLLQAALLALGMRGASAITRRFFHNRRFMLRTTPDGDQRFQNARSIRPEEFRRLYEDDWAYVLPSGRFREQSIESLVRNLRERPRFDTLVGRTSDVDWLGVADSRRNRMLLNPRLLDGSYHPINARMTIHHEATHLASSRALRRSADQVTINDIGRNVSFQSRRGGPDLPGSSSLAHYAKSFRADEVEARVRQLAVLRLYQGSLERANAEDLRRHIELQSRLLRSSIDRLRLARVETSRGGVLLEFPRTSSVGEGFVVSIPGVRFSNVDEARSYARSILSDRLQRMEFYTSWLERRLSRPLR